MNHPTCGGGGGPSGGPKEQQPTTRHTPRRRTRSTTPRPRSRPRRRTSTLSRRSWTSWCRCSPRRGRRPTVRRRCPRPRTCRRRSRRRRSAAGQQPGAPDREEGGRRRPDLLVEPPAPAHGTDGAGLLRLRLVHGLRHRGRPVQHRQEDLRRHRRQPRGGDGDAVRPAAEAAGQRRNRSGQGELDRGVGRPARGRLRHRRFWRRPARFAGRWPAALDRRTRPADGRRTVPHLDPTDGGPDYRAGPRRRLRRRRPRPAAPAASSRHRHPRRLRPSLPPIGGGGEPVPWTPTPSVDGTLVGGSGDPPVRGWVLRRHWCRWGRGIVGRRRWRR